MSEKLKLTLAAVLFFSAITLFFSFFSIPCAFIADGSIVNLQTPERTPLPIRQTNIQSILVRSTSPAVNANRNENSSNPPLNRAYGALFQRTFIHFSMFYSAAVPHAVLILRKKYLINSLPVRAGPFNV